MATVEFRYDPKNTAWFTANAAMVLKAGEPAYHDTTGLFKLGDGVTALSALSFLPTVSSSSATIQQVLTTGNVATTTIETTGFIKTGGTFAEFLKADGSVDNNYYLTYLDISASTPLNFSNLTGVFSMNQSSALSDGYLSSTDWSTFNGKQDAISLTTNNSNGAATLISNVLNVPNYTLAGLGGTTLAAVNAQNLSVFAATTSSQLAGVISDETGTGSLVFGTSPTFTTSLLTPNVTGISGNLVFTNAAQSSGAITNFTLINSFNTNQTATKNIPNFIVSGANKQWATGTVPLQYFNHLTANTVSAVGASTFTSVYGLFVEAATAGTNATITNNWAIGANGGGIIVRGAAGTGLDVGNLSSLLSVNCSSGVTSAYNIFVTNGAMTIQTVTPTLVFNNSAVQVRRNSNSLFLDTYDDLTVRNTLSLYNMLVLRGTKTTGALISFDFTAPTNTNQTLSTNIPNFKITGSNKQWAGGAGVATLATQYFNYFTANTVAFVNANTATNVYNLFVEAPIAGTNATITNNYALGLAGSLKINDTFNIVFDTTTGTKIATSTTQKISFWNATPIVQPTTAVAAATVVSGTGGNVKHDDTFDGYTVEQVVRALRTIGLLA